MALVRLDPNANPFGALLGLQDELERFMRNPAFAMGPSGAGAYPPVNIFDSPEGALIVAEIPGLDTAKLSVTGTGHTLAISGERQLSPMEAAWAIIAASCAKASFPARFSCRRITRLARPMPATRRDC